MPQSFASLADLRAHGFDALIDVRSPSEYAEDHVPGAISLPVLSDAERAAVGTMYKQVSAFDARKHGAALVARNAADHIDAALARHDGAWRPLVYCWRGGQRSGSFTSILQQIGWRADTVQGGYQTYRKLVQTALYDTPQPFRLILLDGNTGTAKTDILNRLPALGLQTVDLEGLANHRGSLLGGMGDGQPSQKAFESRLATALEALDPARPVIVEAESSRIGRLTIPPQIWAPMCAAPRIEIAAPLTARAAYLTRAYADVIADPDRLAAQLQPLRAHRGHAMVDGWLALLHAGNFTALATALMAEHYDAAYARSRGVHDRTRLARLDTDTLDAGGQDRLARDVARIVERL